MEKSILSQKHFRQSSSPFPDTLAEETKIWISRMKKHLEITNCDHCKRVLNNIEIEAGGQPTPSIPTSATNPFRNQSKQVT